MTLISDMDDVLFGFARTVVFYKCPKNNHEIKIMHAIKGRSGTPEMSINQMRRIIYEKMKSN